MKALLTFTALDTIANAQNRLKLTLPPLSAAKVFIQDNAAVFMTHWTPH
jgi:hypothetical protein